MFLNDRPLKVKSAPHCSACQKRRATHRVETQWYCEDHSPLARIREALSLTLGRKISNPDRTMKSTKIAEPSLGA